MSSITFLNVFLICIALQMYEITANGIEIPRHHRDDQILNQMLSIERYDSRLRPEAHTVVNVSITILTLSSPDESSLTYEIELLLHLTWNDFRLKYEDRGKHKYLNALKHSDKLWLPDLYFIKHGKMPHKHVNDIIALKIYNTGDIHFTNRYDLQIQCSANLKIFPFDSPECNFAIESKFITHEKHQLELIWAQFGPIVYSKSISATNAYLVQNTTTICTERQSWRQDYSCLSAVLFFTRDKSYYLSVYFIPTIILVSLTFLSFWMSVERLALGRIVFNLSSLLGLIILFITFRTNLPVVSNISSINLWEFVSTLFVSLANIHFIIELNKKKTFSETEETEYRQRLPSKGVPEEVEIREPLCDRQSIEMTRIGGQNGDQLNNSEKRIGNSTQNRRSSEDIIKYVFPILYYSFVLIYFITIAIIKAQNNY